MSLVHASPLVKYNACCLFVNDVTSIHIRAYTSIQKALFTNTCLLLSLILYLQAQAHTSTQKCIIHKTPACCNFDFVPARASTHINSERLYSQNTCLPLTLILYLQTQYTAATYEMNLNVSLRMMPAADSPQQNRTIKHK